MKVKVVTLDNKPAGEVTLKEDIFAVPVRADILQRVVRWQLAKRQAGTHKVKGVGEVRGTTAKPHKQKGTGMARQGSKRNVHMRGGAVIFGPVVRSHAHDLPKAIRKLGLKVALSSKQKEGKLHILKEAALEEKKSASLAKKLKQLGWDSVLFIDGAEVNINFRQAASNLKHVDVLPCQGANVYDILGHDNLVITEQGLKQLEERLHG